MSQSQHAVAASTVFGYRAARRFAISVQPPTPVSFTSSLSNLGKGQYAVRLRFLDSIGHIDIGMKMSAAMRSVQFNNLKASTVDTARAVHDDLAHAVRKQQAELGEEPATPSVNKEHSATTQSHVRYQPGAICTEPFSHNSSNLLAVDSGVTGESVRRQHAAP